MGWNRSKGGSGGEGGAYAASVSKGAKRGGKTGGGRDGGAAKPTDDPGFVQWSVGMIFAGSKLGVTYMVDAYVASGTFSRVFRVHPVKNADEVCKSEGTKRRWSRDGTEAVVFAAKVQRKNDAYIQYKSDAQKEGDLLQTIEQAQSESGADILTMRCFDSFATKDNAGNDYWCLILEWLDASLFDVVHANSGRGLHLSMVRVLLAQLLEQVRLLQKLHCTHTDIKHKNCCLVDTEYFMAPGKNGGPPDLILTRPMAKLIDYGNATFEGEPKGHPIHTKQFRAPEVLLNMSQGWGPASDVWTLGITAAFLVSGQLLFNSHDPNELMRSMVAALGPVSSACLATAQDHRLRRVAEEAARSVGPPQLRAWLAFDHVTSEDSPEGRCTDLLRRMLEFDPAQRISPEEALRHPFFTAGEPAVPERTENLPLRTLSGPRERNRGKGK